MAGKLKINREAIANILLSAPVQKLVDRVGRDMAKEAGPGYEYKPPTRNQQRSRGIVVPATHAARVQERQTMRLSKVLISYRI